MDSSGLAQAAEATLVFAQEEAGTAVCISPQGLIMTCSHCVAENPEGSDWAEHKWMLFASGQIVQAKSSPLALTLSISSFPFISVAEYPPPLRATLICIGHPGSEDLEVSRPSIKTGYDVLHISTGLSRGYASGQDAQDNLEIGALTHDCWTYWGHSGAPLVETSTGCLDTGMRHGISLEAIQQFMQHFITTKNEEVQVLHVR
ncbi:uncharacterized protein K441DRAFT_690180 [Cenococcum geophilum 1.58]|uniref:uncharacterized protein n=1 Tax=Cenococcum geophilum 1.58 TaxID=794803 RepID=UPI00358F0121|nr:hypothetical protein K441DRAFT_690180 [Cenococcum geophilum 1.58]